MKSNGLSFSTKSNEMNRNLRKSPFAILTESQRCWIQKHLNIGEGIDIRSLNESYICNVWNASREANVGDVDILKSLQKLTGLTTNSLRSKVIRRDTTVLVTVKAMYENL